MISDRDRIEYLINHLSDNQLDDDVIDILMCRKDDDVEAWMKTRTASKESAK